MSSPSRLVIFALLLCASRGVDASLTADDFGYGSEILLERETALWEVVLPPTVYRHIARPDLGDIRVFNNEGVTVPHILRRPRARSEAPPAPASLSVFPLYSAPDGTLIGRRMRVVTDESGAIVQAETEEISSGEKQRLAAYLVDIHDLTRPPSHLQLHWRNANDDGLAAAVRIEGSNDLTTWAMLVDEATIADLRSGAERLIRRNIALPESHWKYLRIDWPAALNGIELEKVVALFAPQSIEQARNWMDVSGKVESTDRKVYEFDVNGHFPIDRARIGFSEDNVVARGTLSSRASRQSGWTRRDRGVYFNVRSGGELVQSEAIELPQTTDRYWRLELKLSEEDLATVKPTLALGWVPQELTFVAQGTAPFILAYGSSVAAPSDKPVAELLTALDQGRGTGVQINRAGLGPERELGGEGRLMPPAPPLPWKTWLLWSVLILGVILLARMVLGLWRQIEHPASND